MEFEADSLSQLSASFVTQYYDGLLQPASLATCYGPDSVMSIHELGVDSTDGKIVEGPAMISKQLEILSNLLEKAQLHILNAEVFPSFDDSALIIVLGVSVTETAAQRFHHTVILRRNGVEGEYYIRNDVWRFLPKESEASKMDHSARAESVQEEVAKTESVAGRSQKTASQEPESNRDSDNEQEEEKAISERDGSVASSPQHSTPSPSASQQSAPASNPGPKNWASVIKTTPATTKPAATKAPQRISPKPEPKTSAPKPDEKRPVKREEKPVVKCRITIKVKQPVSDDQVRKVIPAKLLPSLVSLRNLSEDKFVVFVDFSDPEGLEILQAEDLYIDDRKVIVEKQREKPRTS